MRVNAPWTLVILALRHTIVKFLVSINKYDKNNARSNIDVQKTAKHEIGKSYHTQMNDLSKNEDKFRALV